MWSTCSFAASSRMCAGRSNRPFPSARSTNCRPMPHRPRMPPSTACRISNWPATQPAATGRCSFVPCSKRRCSPHRPHVCRHCANASAGWKDGMPPILTWSRCANCSSTCRPSILRNSASCSGWCRCSRARKRLRPRPVCQLQQPAHLWPRLHRRALPAPWRCR